ncbi:MAG: hypothetical protein CMJ34_07480 [Phycisphaerae bacterium]|nr:hypothetical protein [Phycisphaerae bacterium]
MNGHEDRPATALVVGAGGGIGRSVVRRLSGRGFAMVGIGRNQDRLNEVEGLDERRVCDATSFEDLDEVVRSIVEDPERPPLGAIINLAGCITLKPAHLIDEKTWNDTIAQKLTTAFTCVRSAGRHMKEGGSVVLVSTVAAGIGLANHEAIAAAGAGVEGLARSAAATYAGRGLRVNVVAPALVDTPMASRITSSERALEHSRKMHPLGRIGTPEDVSPAIEWLATEDSGWITGQVIGVDGGLSRVRSG